MPNPSDLWKNWISRYFTQGTWLAPEMSCHYLQLSNYMHPVTMLQCLVLEILVQIVTLAVALRMNI